MVKTNGDKRDWTHVRVLEEGTFTCPRTKGTRKTLSNLPRHLARNMPEPEEKMNRIDPKNGDIVIKK